jgi:hypothetical protein
MVPLFIFYLHTVAVAYAFTKRWQEEGVKEGVLAVAFVAVIFSVGWTLATFLLRLVSPPEGFGSGLGRDALSLLLLTVGEGFFYYWYLEK